MMRRCTPGLGVLAGILATSFAPAALAEGPDCAAVAIEADPTVQTRWPGLVDDVRVAFEALDDVDRCARVELTADKDAPLRVRVVLPDGRSAARSVSRTEDVIPTLEALLLVPERSPPVPASTSSAPAPEPMPHGAPDVLPARALALPEREAPATTHEHGPRVRIELSALTGVRMGDGQAAIGLGAFSFLELSGWLVGFEGRADRYRVLSGATPDGGVLELAVLGGRRLRSGSIAVDLVAGPAVVLQGTTSFERQSPAVGGTVSGTSSSAVTRLLAGARLNFGALSVLHTFVGVDGELGSPRAGDGDAMPNAPRLPVWTLGLALGATVGTP